MKDLRSTEPARNNGASRRIPGMEFGPGGLPPSASEGDLVGRVKFRSKAEVYVRDETVVESSASLKKLQARSDLMSAHVLLDGERMADYDDEATVATGVTLESRYQGESGLFSNKQIRNQVRSPHSLATFHQLNHQLCVKHGLCFVGPPPPPFTPSSPTHHLPTVRLPCTPVQRRDMGDLRKKQKAAMDSFFRPINAPGARSLQKWIQNYAADRSTFASRYRWAQAKLVEAQQLVSWRRRLRFANISLPPHHPATPPLHHLTHPPTHHPCHFRSKSARCRTKYWSPPPLR